MKKSILVAGVLAAGVLMNGTALAADGAALSKSNGCTTCHDATKKKMGPSVADIAAKYKGQAGAEDKLVAALKEGKGHPKSKASEADLKVIVAWMLQ